MLENSGGLRMFGGSGEKTKKGPSAQKRSPQVLDDTVIPNSCAQNTKTKPRGLSHLPQSWPIMA